VVELQSHGLHNSVGIMQLLQMLTKPSVHIVDFCSFAYSNSFSSVFEIMSW